MSSSPRISIIIPIFNGAHYINDVLQALINQTFKDFEIIIVDDGSTDNTKILLAPWFNKLPINYIYQSNKGLAAARNTGIRHAKGKYLKFLDCDDTIYPNQLNEQYAQLEGKSENVISITNYDLEFNNKNKKSINVWLGNSSQLARAIENNFGPIHALLIPRHAAQQLGGFDENLKACEDWDFLLRLLMNNYTLEKIKNPGCCYRILEASMSAQQDKMFNEHCKLSEKLNATLGHRLNSYPAEVTHELLSTNTRLMHMCYIRRLNPSQYLPITFKTSQSMYQLQPKGIKSALYQLLRLHLMNCLFFIKNIITKKNYIGVLMLTSWREEKNYV